ncbi:MULTISPECIES: FKBP-type peptidyl-prolyl cis-trans isomerase [Microbacterium]|uniref:peptidylprolyl isomerase n=1 Tax=Microbacterium trichothecenolyticum TaxID=69370 RepID=A0A0M2HFD9_MICTR|nr:MULTISPECIES: FKBP-type peptidyl-prolyl cis-trans isomerase [Microbacterium]KJL45379.1 putative FKBP-type peptidyl-prolyl cis-trans isomerase [Microbacterium trichothecenolyticum]MDR7189282.1 peptidylprolyl isomerase [Microbacterium sp. BE35]
MRIRPFAALSVVAAATLLLAGCTGSADPNATPTPTSTASSECGLDPQEGADSDAVTVSGTAPELTADVPTDLEFADLQRTVATAGDGDDLAVGQLVSGQYQIIDPATGEVQLDSATTSADDSGLVPLIVDASSIVGSAVLCTPLGSSTAFTIPGSMLGDGASNVVVVAQSVDELPTAATGEDQDPVAGMPEVELAENGEPTITVADDFAAPDTTQIAVLKKGDGATVESGDNVFVQYTGILPDGTVFDSSWQRGAPAQFQTTGVVQGFQKALEGQTVGSQVIAVIPASEGYGDTAQGSIPANSPLIFVVDILGVQRAAAQQ